MQIIMTGMNGTGAPVFADHLREQGCSVLPWIRESVPVDNEQVIRIFIEESRPDWICHLATGSPDWAELIARLCEEYQIRLLYTSSVSVFSSAQKGPFGVSVEPVPDDDYGRYKLECEQRMSAQNPQILIARLGWQIGDAPGSNNMFDFLFQRNKEDGKINASTNWFPACAFLEDTAEALHQLLKNTESGLFHLDANPGLHFYDIAGALNNKYRKSWEILPVEEPVINSLMKDDRVNIKSIKKRLLN